MSVDYISTLKKNVLGSKGAHPALTPTLMYLLHRRFLQHLAVSDQDPQPFSGKILSSIKPSLTCCNSKIPFQFDFCHNLEGRCYRCSTQAEMQLRTMRPNIREQTIARLQTISARSSLPLMKWPTMLPTSTTGRHFNPRPGLSLMSALSPY